MNKCTALWQQTSGDGRVAGWSETWYTAGTFGAAAIAFINTIAARAALLSAAAKCIGLRVQVPGGQTYAQTLSVPGSAGSLQDVPMMAVNLKVYSPTNPNTKIFQLRGVPDATVVLGAYAPSANFTANLSAYIKNVSDNNMCWQAINRTTPQVNIVSIAADGTFVFAGAVTYAQGDYIQVMRARNVNGVRVSGKFYVATKVDAQNGKFANWVSGQVLGNGKVRPVSIIYPLVSNAPPVVLGITTRKVGRPFGLYHGRRTKR